MQTLSSLALQVTLLLSLHLLHQSLLSCICCFFPFLTFQECPRTQVLGPLLYRYSLHGGFILSHCFQYPTCGENSPPRTSSLNSREVTNLDSSRTSPINIFNMDSYYFSPKLLHLPSVNAMPSFQVLRPTTLGSPLTPSFFSQSIKKNYLL